MVVVASLLYPLLLCAPPDPVKEWQVRYDFMISGMKRHDATRLVKRLHKDYTELANGLVVGRADVLKQIPARMDTLANFENHLKVVSVKAVGATTRVNLTMVYKATKTENKRKATYISTSKLLDTWVKVGTDWQLYRSAVLESKTTRNGKVLKKPGG